MRIVIISLCLSFLFQTTLFGQDSKVHTTLKVVDWRNIPVINANEAKGGLHELADLTGLYGIPTERLTKGMLVVVLNADGNGAKKTYQYIGNESTNTAADWNEIMLINKWLAGSYYQIGKMVIYNASYYICETAHTAGASFNATEKANWRAIWDSPTTYSIGLNAALGGYVFYVTPNGKHGLVAATQDQSSSVTYMEAFNECNDPANHNVIGKEFTDWRLPTTKELALMYAQRVAIGDFSSNRYWSSIAHSVYYGQFYFHNFSNNSSYYTDYENYSYRLRAVRAF
jgi:hypothetical protein